MSRTIGASTSHSPTPLQSFAALKSPTRAVCYGCDIHVFDVATIAQQLDSVCVRLLTRYPTARRHLKTDPLRGLRFLLTNPLQRAYGRDRILGRRSFSIVEKGALTNEDWLTRSKCEICQICDLPLVDDAYGAGYH